MTFAYDQQSDVLYITFDSSKAAASYIEVQEGIVLRVSKKNRKVLGCTIAMFAARSESGIVRVPQLGPV